MNNLSEITSNYSHMASNPECQNLFLVLYLHGENQTLIFWHKGLIGSFPPPFVSFPFLRKFAFLIETRPDEVFEIVEFFDIWVLPVWPTFEHNIIANPESSNIWIRLSDIGLSGPGFPCCIRPLLLFPERLEYSRKTETHFPFILWISRLNARFEGARSSRR